MFKLNIFIFYELNLVHKKFDINKNEIIYI